MGLRRTAEHNSKHSELGEEKVFEMRRENFKSDVLLTLIIYRLRHHVSTNAEVQPLQGRLQLHAHMLEHPVISSQRGQESGQHWRRG